MINNHTPETDRDKILKHSRIKFHRDGFYKTSMDEIARDLRISKKTIYKYFPSKNVLLKDICNETTAEIIKNIDFIVEGKEDVVIKFVKLLNMYGNFLRNISDKWFKDISIHAPNIKREIDSRRNDKINKILIKLLKQGKKEKLITNYPAQLILSTFTSSLMSVMQPEFLINNKFSMHDAFIITYEMLLNGILTDKGKDKFKKEKAKLAREILG